MNKEQMKFFNLLEQETPPHPREFLKMAHRFGLEEKDIQESLVKYLSEVVLGEEIYHARITPKLLEKLQEQIELGTETIDLENWSEKFAEFIFQTQGSKVGRTFVERLTKKGFNEETAREAVDIFATLTEKEIGKFLLTAPVESMFVEFFEKYTPKPGSEIPSALFYPVIKSIGGKSGDKIRTDLILALREGTIELFIEKLEEDFGAYIPEKVKELLRSKRGIVAGEIKIFAQDLAKDTIKYLEEGIVQIALYRGTATAERLANIILLRDFPGLEPYLGVKAPEELAEELEKAMEAKKKWEREITSKVIEKGLGESFNKSIDPLLELLKGTDANVDDIKKKIEDFLNNLNSIIRGD